MLHELDRLWEDRCRQLGQLVRYADDFVILCRTRRREPAKALRRVGLILARLGLTLHPEKTRVVVRGGWARRASTSWGSTAARWNPGDGRGKRYLQLLAEPTGDAAGPGAHQSDHGTAASRCRSRSRRIVDELNPVLRGLGRLLPGGQRRPRSSQQVDSYVRERLALFLSKKTGRSGRRLESATRWTFFQRARGLPTEWNRRAGARQRRQRRGERSRKAGCGRTACPV